MNEQTEETRVLRGLTKNEIEQLKQQSCTADDWQNIRVPAQFTPLHIHHTHFSGEISLGTFNHTFTLEGGLIKQAGLYNV